MSENASVTSQVNINPPFGSMGHLEDPRLFKNTNKPDNSGRVQEPSESKNSRKINNESGIDFATPV
jgi:hypothetical protein